MIMRLDVIPLIGENVLCSFRRKTTGEDERMLLFMCTYVKETGNIPCCTHECDGCIWYEDDDQE